MADGSPDLSLSLLLDRSGIAVRYRALHFAVAACIAIAPFASGLAQSGLSAPPVAPPCSDVSFIGLRGSGESATENQGMGEVPEALFRLFAGERVAAIGLPYDASRSSGKDKTAAQQAVDDGARIFIQAVNDRSNSCPAEQIVAVGYSLGADVLGDALTTTASPRIVAAVLFADPWFNPSDTATAVGTFDSSFGGDRGQRAPYAARLAPRVRSYCRRGDVICQANAPGATKSEHGRYAPDQVCEAAKFVASRIGMRAPACRGSSGTAESVVGT